MTPEELQIVRRAYAMNVMAAAGVDDARVLDAFAAVPREAFLGPGPWPLYRFWEGYVPSPGADPVYLYTNGLVGIAPERHINNGEPSLHALLIARAAPKRGDHVVHVGAGVGYYTAILAELAGPAGRVTAIEYEADLAERARGKFAGRANVGVIHGDGTTAAFDPADVIYVNAGVVRPPDIWLDRLRDGGRLILPLTTELGFRAQDGGDMRRRGAVFRIERRGADYLATWISPVAIYPCSGARDAVDGPALADAFARGGWERVTRLYRDDDVPPERCWLKMPGFCLACD